MYWIFHFHKDSNSLRITLLSTGANRPLYLHPRKRGKQNMARQGHNKGQPMPNRKFTKKIKENTRWNNAMVEICWAKAPKTLFLGLLLLSSESLTLPNESRSGSSTAPLLASPSPTALRWSKLETSSPSSTKIPIAKGTMNEAITIPTTTTTKSKV